MSFASYHSTSLRGLNATTQAPQELRDSKKFLEVCDASPIRKKINPLHPEAKSPTPATDKVKGWDATFLRTLREKRKRSPKQRAILKSIVEKVGGAS